mmetsp:Transcript_98435/g.195213  ORF Transcript_98435/g.195213 Transcript_98435/m.195213 type:complete len:393 (+) Transcript_98435:92-1270(+)
MATAAAPYMVAALPPTLQPGMLQPGMMPVAHSSLGSAHAASCGSSVLTDPGAVLHPSTASLIVPTHPVMQAAAAPGMQLLSARPAQPPIHVTESDRLAWMQQFIRALEGWTDFLDSMADAQATDASAAAGNSGHIDPLQGTAASSHSSGDAAALAAYAATARAQYLQQCQLMQQLQQQGAARPSNQLLQLPTSSTARFKDNFRPMRMCKHFAAAGFCKQGDQCTFAHTHEELHSSSTDVHAGGRDQSAAAVPVAPQAAAANDAGTFQNSAGHAIGVSSVSGPASESAPLDLRLRKKRELCGRFARGTCALGRVCSFAHGEEELDTVGLTVCGRVKTQNCRDWEAGRCAYGDACSHAHGDLEIGAPKRPLEQAPPIKRRREDEAAITDTCDPT